jgi:hypothetical protein
MPKSLWLAHNWRKDNRVGVLPRRGSPHRLESLGRQKGLFKTEISICRVRATRQKGARKQKPRAGVAAKKGELIFCPIPPGPRMFEIKIK